MSAPESPPTTLRPLPPPPIDRSGGYRWVIIMISVAGLVALAVTAWFWYSLPTFPLLGSTVWWLTGSLMVTVPLFVLLGLISCAGLAGLRRMRSVRRWPPILQALPVVLTVLWLTFMLGYWLVTSAPET